MAEMDLMEQLRSLGSQNTTIRQKGDTSDPIVSEMETDGTLDNLRTSLGNKKDMAATDAAIQSSAKPYQSMVEDWDKEIKYHQDLLDHPDTTGPKVDVLMKNLEYAKKKRDEYAAQVQQVEGSPTPLHEQQHSPIEFRRGRVWPGVAHVGTIPLSEPLTLPETAVERGLLSGLEGLSRYTVAAGQTFSETLGLAGLSQRIADYRAKEAVRRLQNPGSQPLQWKDAAGFSGVMSYVGESVGATIPWMAGMVVGEVPLITMGVVAGQGMMREALEEAGVTDPATLRKGSYTYGTLIGGLQAVVPWATLRGVTKEAQTAFYGTVGRIAAKVAARTSKVTASQMAAMELSTWAEMYGVSDLSGQPIDWDKVYQQSMETARQGFIGGLSFGALGEGMRAAGGGYKIGKKPETSPEGAPPITPEQSAQIAAMREEQRLAELATVKTPEAQTEATNIRTERYNKERDALVGARQKIEQEELTPLDNELRDLDARKDLSEVERAALEADINLQRSEVMGRIEGADAQIEAFKSRLEPQVDAVGQKEAPIVQFRKDAETINASIPAVQEGMTRLWRGNRPEEGGVAQQFTNDLPGIALPFRQAYGGDISYVDVPTSDLNKYVQTVGAATNAEFFLPEEVARMATPVAPPQPAPAKPAPLPPELRADFHKLLTDRVPRKQWAEALAVTPEELSALIDDAQRRGLVRVDRNRVVRRTSKAFTGEEAAPTEIPGVGMVAKTEEAAGRWDEMQQAVDEAVAGIKPDAIKIKVVDAIKAARSTEDQKYAIGTSQRVEESTNAPVPGTGEPAGRTPAERARQETAPTLSRGTSAADIGTAGARIVRREAATLRPDGSVIVGRRVRGKGSRREGDNIQGVGTTRSRTMFPGYAALILADPLHSGNKAEGVISKLDYRFYDKSEGKKKSVSPNDAAVHIEAIQHEDGAWEIGWLRVQPDQRGKKLATQAYNAIEKDLGIKLSPSGLLTDEGLAFWKKRSPESVKWHKSIPGEEGMNYSPRKIIDEISRLEDIVKDVPRRSYLSAKDKAELIADHKTEIATLRKMWDALPAEAKTPQVTDSMFALRGFYSPAIRAAESISAKGPDANILGQAKPDEMVIYLAAKAIENEARANNRSPISEAIKTARHEVMEMMKGLDIISEQDWSRLTGAARKQGWVEEHGVREPYGAAYDEALKSGRMAPDQFEDLLLKEAIFEQFAKFESGEKTYPKNISGIFQRVLDFFRGVMRGVRKMGGFERPEDIFLKYNQGEFKKQFQKEFGDMAGRPQPVDQMLAARRQPIPVETAMADVRSDLGLEKPKNPWKKAKEVGVRQQAVAIATDGGVKIMERFKKELPEFIAPHTEDIIGMALPLSDNPVAEGFSRFWREYILRPELLQQNHPELYSDFGDFLDAHDPHLYENIDRMLTIAKERVVEKRQNVKAPPKEDKSTITWAKNQTPKTVAGAVVNKFHRAIEAYMRSFQPELVSSKAFEADAATAYAKAAGQQKRDAVENAQDELYMKWSKVPVETQLQYIHDMEISAPQATPEMAKMAKDDRRKLEAAYVEEKKWGSRAGYIEDYFPHIWKDPERAKKVLSQLVKTLGPTWFQKARTHETIQAGRDAGLELKSTNPAELITWRLLAGIDMRQRMELLSDYKKLGVAVRVTDKLDQIRAQQLTNAGWETIRAPNMEDWLIAPDVQPIWKNAIEARSLWQQEGLAGNVFRGWMAFKNAWVPIKLSLSGFHPLHVWHIGFSSNLARGFSRLTKTGDFFGALNDVITAPDMRQGIGFDARMAWEKPREERSGHENAIVEIMQDGGFVPHAPREMRDHVQRALAEALQKAQYLKAMPLAMRRGIEKMQAAIFDRWIPGVRAAAYIRQAQLELEAKPWLLDDPSKKRVALRSISKSMENRFGQMFYGNLYWNRVVKDAGIASFLSLGWNLGFLREFGGAPLKALAYPYHKAFKPSDHPSVVAAEANNKIAFVMAYVSTSAMILGTMSYMFTGEAPVGDDYIFPRIGGKNPDGSARRTTQMTYTRELPMLMKHVEEANSWWGGVEEMVWNKMMFQPFVEMFENRDYWGYEIYDSQSPLYKKTAQFVKHIFKTQMSPITISGANRAAELSGTWYDKSIPLAFLGFGPAPAYVERSALENRIRRLYQEQGTPLKKPYDRQSVDEEKRIAKQELRRAIQDNDPEAAVEARKKARAAGATSQTLTTRRLNTPSGTYLFSRLPPEMQRKLLQEATPEERKIYRKYANRKVRREFPNEAVEEAPAQ